MEHLALVTLTHGKVKKSLYRPLGFQKVDACRFQDNQCMKVVRLSALCTGRLYPPGSITCTHFCYRLDQPQATVWLEGSCQ